MTPEQKAEKAAALRAEADAVEVPDPIEYPKWVHYEDGRQSVLVQNSEQHETLKKRIADDRAEREAVAAAEADRVARLAEKEAAKVQAAADEAERVAAEAADDEADSDDAPKRRLGKKK